MELSLHAHVLKHSQIYVLQNILRLPGREKPGNAFLLPGQYLPKKYQVYNHCLVTEQEAKVWVETSPMTKIGINSLHFRNISLQNFVKTASVEDLKETDAPFRTTNFNL